MLKPFIEGKVPKEKRVWHAATKRIASQIPEELIPAAMEILEEMFSISGEKQEVPGAHGVYSDLTVRLFDLREGRGEKRK